MMTTMTRIPALLLVCFIVIACGIATSLGVDSSYILRPGDGVLITVFEQDEFTTETEVSTGGEIEVPLLGTVIVGGRSVKEAVSDLTAKLAKGFVVDPKVTLTVVGGGVDEAIIIGMVNKPGTVQFPAQRKLDALSAIAMAGGFTENANLDLVSIRREVDGKTTVIKVDSRKLTGEDPSSITLEPDDIVSVGQSLARQVTVMGEVDRPGFVEMPRDGAFNLLSAIAVSGGFTETANASNVVVRRGNSIHRLDANSLAYDSGKKAFTLQAGDVVIVGEMTIYTVTLMGEVKSPGLIEIPADSGLTLLEAIAVAGGYTPNANPKRIVVRRRTTEEGVEDKFYRINGDRLAQDAQALPISLQPGDLITVPERFF